MDEGKERFERITSCPACGGNRLRPHTKATFDISEFRAESIRITDSHYGRAWDLARCEDCGHSFADPCPTPAFINALYSALEDPLYDEESGGREKNFLRVFKTLEKLRPEKGRLLDVGSATGILMDLAARLGWETEGVEPSSWAVTYARKKYGLTIHERVFEMAPLEAASFDVVTMIDFIEHTARPYDVMRKAAEVLRPGGLLCIVTPDIRSAASRLARGKWWHLRPAHLACFSRRSLDALLKRTGFSVVRRKSYSWTFSAHYLATRLRVSRFLACSGRPASFLKRIPIKLALGDSFEIYARKKEGM